MKKILQLTFILIILTGCSSTKRMSYEELMEGAPGWVRQTPNETVSYHGVGMASKLQDDNFREKARQNALATLAGSISVNVSSESVLNQFEFDNNYSDYYRDNIRLSTQKMLEGYELVDTWENEQQYWVYYRLSKSKYKSLKKQRIQKARSASEADYLEARSKSAEGNAAEALRLYIEAAGEISGVLAEDLGKAPGNRQKSYSTALFTDLAAMLQTLRIVFPVEELTVKRGKSPEQETIMVKVLDGNGNPASGVPVVCRFSWDPGDVREKRSDASGTFRLKPGSVNSPKVDEFIFAQVDIGNILRENRADPLIRKLIGGISIPEYVLPVRIIPLHVDIDAQLKNLGETFDAAGLLSTFRQLFERDGIFVRQLREESDYVLHIESSTIKGKQRNGRYSASLTATFTLTDKNGREVLVKRIEDVPGLGDDWEMAGTDAYLALEERIPIGIYPDVYGAMLNK